MAGRGVCVFLFLVILYLQCPLPRCIFACNGFSCYPTDPKDENYTTILQDVLKEVAGKQEWDLEDIRVSKLDSEKVSYANAQRYEIRIGFGKTQVVAKFPDEISSWNEASKKEIDFGSLIGEVGSMAALSSFKLQGPFDLRVEGNDMLSLILPIKVMHLGLKRLIVGEGIILEVSGAREASVFHASYLGKLLNQKASTEKKKNDFYSFWHSYCVPLLPIRIFGSANIVAYKSGNADSYIETSLISNETMELLADKCHSSQRDIRHIFPVDSLNLRINLLKNVLRRDSGLSFERGRIVGFVKGTMEASGIIRFRLELERKVGRNENVKGLLGEWRTLPTVERNWFEVLAEVENERLRPLAFKKVKPFIMSDSTTWSHIMSNISFTKLPSLLLSSQGLTLGIK